MQARNTTAVNPQTLIEDLQDALRAEGQKPRPDANILRRLSQELVDVKAALAKDAKAAAAKGEVAEHNANFVDREAPKAGQQPLKVRFGDTKAGADLEKLKKDLASSVVGQRDAVGAMAGALATNDKLWLAGPPGSGKSKAAQAAASTLGLEFRSFSAAELNGAGDLMKKLTEAFNRPAALAIEGASQLMSATTESVSAWIEKMKQKWSATGTGSVTFFIDTMAPTVPSRIPKVIAFQPLTPDNLADIASRAALDKVTKARKEVRILLDPSVIELAKQVDPKDGARPIVSAIEGAKPAPGDEDAKKLVMKAEIADGRYTVTLSKVE